MLARIEEDFVIERHGRIDLGERQVKSCATSCSADMVSGWGQRRAKSYASQEGYRVFIYPLRRLILLVAPSKTYAPITVENNC